MSINVKLCFRAGIQSIDNVGVVSSIINAIQRYVVLSYWDTEYRQCSCCVEHYQCQQTLSCVVLLGYRVSTMFVSCRALSISANVKLCCVIGIQSINSVRVVLSIINVNKRYVLVSTMFVSCRALSMPVNVKLCCLIANARVVSSIINVSKHYVVLSYLGYRVSTMFVWCRTLSTSANVKLCCLTGIPSIDNVRVVSSIINVSKRYVVLLGYRVSTMLVSCRALSMSANVMLSYWDVEYQQCSS